MGKEYVTKTKADRKIAICGTSKTTRHLAPFDDPTWEIWTLGHNYKTDAAPRKDRHFEMHDFDAGAKRWTPEYLAWLRRPDCELITQGPTIHCPTARAYPLEKIEAEFGEYWTCSIAYMIALAAFEGATTIGVFGCDLAQESEYAYQRPSVEFVLGVCKGRGIQIVVPETSDLLKTGAKYGYQTAGGQQMPAWMLCQSARMQELKQRQQLLSHEISEKQKESFVLAGALEAHSWMRKYFPKAEALVDEARNGNGFHAEKQLHDVGQLQQGPQVPDACGTGGETDNGGQSKAG